jgi:glycogen synthase
VQKGLDVLLDAQAHHLAHHPHNLLIAGDGEPALAARITAAVASAPGANVRFLHRHLPRQEVRALLGAVDFAVIPSRFEPFGLIQLEAMAMGALPLVSRVGGLRDVVLDVRAEGGFGQLFEPGDAEGLAGALREMARLARERPETLERARQAARERARAHSARAMAEQYERLYASLLEGREREGLRRAS